MNVTFDCPNCGTKITRSFIPSTGQVEQCAQCNALFTPLMDIKQSFLQISPHVAIYDATHQQPSTGTAPVVQQ